MESATLHHHVSDYRAENGLSILATTEGGSEMRCAQLVAICKPHSRMPLFDLGHIKQHNFEFLQNKYCSIYFH